MIVHRILSFRAGDAIPHVNGRPAWQPIRLLGRRRNVLSAMATHAPSVGTCCLWRSEMAEDRDVPRSAIDVVVGLGVGRRFKLRRRVFTLRSYGGASHYAACSQGGERSVFPVWNEDGKPTTVTVRPDSPVRPVE